MKRLFIAFTILLTLASSAFGAAQSSYPNKTTPVDADRLTGVDGAAGAEAGKTKNFLLSALKTYMGIGIAINLKGDLANLLYNDATAITTVLQAKDSPATEVDGSAAKVLTAAEVGNTIITNYGMADEDTELTLPTAAAGYAALFTVGTARAHKWAIKAGASDKIYLIEAAGTLDPTSDNGAVKFTAAQVGQSAACWTFKTGASTYDWQCKAGAIGTSTFVKE